MIKPVFILLSGIALFSNCKRIDCQSIPTNFSSYEEAQKIITSATYQVDERIRTSKSSWIKSAHYFSCDGRQGYLLLILEDRQYIHANVPIHIWGAFKEADSFGNYYDNYIKGRYRLSI